MIKQTQEEINSSKLHVVKKTHKVCRSDHAILCERPFLLFLLVSIFTELQLRLLPHLQNLVNFLRSTFSVLALAGGSWISAKIETNSVTKANIQLEKHWLKHYDILNSCITAYWAVSGNLWWGTICVNCFAQLSITRLLKELFTPSFTSFNKSVGRALSPLLPDVAFIIFISFKVLFTLLGGELTTVLVLFHPQGEVAIDEDEDMSSLEVCCYCKSKPGNARYWYTIP